MKMLFSVVAASFLLFRPECNAAANNSLLRTEHDIYKCALEWRLAADPLGKHGRCYVYIGNGHIEGLATQLNDPRLVVQAGAPDPKSAPRRWYWLRLGKIDHGRAFLMLRDPKSGLRALELVKHSDQWHVVSDKPFTLT